jgi:hypothetical protein
MFASLIGLVPSLAGAETKPAPAKKEPAKVAAKKPVKPKKPVSAEHKKALAELGGGFKLGMTKDEVIAVFSKQLDEQYDEKLKDTSDITAQDRLRADKRKEVTRLQQSYVSFETAKASPWDVSIVEDEFAHNTGEAMLERWENQGGKNQRRFFFFYEGKLWKMFLSLDMSVLSEDSKNFASFENSMTNAYGPGDVSVETGSIAWRTDEFELRAVDKLKTYDALGLVVSDARVQRVVEAARAAKAPPPRQANTMINGVIDKDKNDHPDTRSNSNAVDTVIKAQGGTPPKH